ncbi:hypothetical protein L596_029407 [Steinernema carpocapsae]|uniref:Uncharacterized protein n=1 Tax=Steinernema carpocapsae TaxID=34508 RepID=A0A4U5LUJ6_STECR|nr:hypothetical protein L596_029407 [Steinernema carpocapsae]
MKLFKLGGNGVLTSAIFAISASNMCILLSILSIFSTARSFWVSSFFARVSEAGFDRKPRGKPHFYALKGVICDYRRTENKKGIQVIHPEESANDYIDAYLIEMPRRDDVGELMGYFSDKWMASNLLDLYVGGTETSISFLLLRFLYMLSKPEIGKKLTAEVMKTTGGNRHVEMTRPLCLTPTLS